MLFYVGTYTRLGGPGIAICSLDSKITRLKRGCIAESDLCHPFR